MQRVARLAASGQSVRAACRQIGVSEKTYYKWKARGSADGGVPARAAPGRRRGVELDEAQQQRIAAFSLLHPSLGCDEIARQQRVTRRRVSASTVQKILRTKNLSTRDDRWRELVRRARAACSNFSDEQLSFILEWDVAKTAGLSLAKRQGEIFVVYIERSRNGLFYRGVDLAARAAAPISEVTIVRLKQALLRSSSERATFFFPRGNSGRRPYTSLIDALESHGHRVRTLSLRHTRLRKIFRRAFTKACRGKRVTVRVDKPRFVERFRKLMGET